MKKLILFLFFTILFTQFLSAQKSDIDKKLLDAVYDNHVHKVKKYIKKGADVNAIYIDQTVLFLACYPNSFKIAKLLIDNGADVNAKIQNDSSELNGVTPLLRALRYYNIKLAELLIERGANVNVSLGNYTPLLYTFYKLRNYDLARKMIEKGADVNVQMSTDSILWGYSGYTPLLFAVYKKDFELAKLILEKGANPNVSVSKNADKYLFPGYSPLLMAFQTRNHNIAKLLIEKGADVNPELPLNLFNNHVGSPLHFSIIGNYEELTKELIRKGANVNSIVQTSDFFYGSPPIYVAMWKNMPETVKMILQKDPDLSIRDRDGRTVLFYSEFLEKNLDIANLLIDKGANINAQIPAESNNPSYTPLIYALKAESYNYAKLLIERGADVNIDNQNCESNPLLICLKNRNYDLSKLIIEHGADVNRTFSPHDEYYPAYTPLEFAIRFSNYDFAKFLIKKGAKVNSTNIDLYLNLLIAVKANNLDSVQLLLENGADINAMYHDNNNILHVATVSNADIQIVKLLLEKGIDVNSINTFDESPLYLSVEQWNNEIAKLLLENGANANIKALYKVDEIRTPLMKAADANNIECCILLIEYNADRYITNNKGQSALDVAIKKNNTIIADIIENYDKFKIKYAAFLAFEKLNYIELPSLIQKQEDINLKYKFDWTLLHYAVLHNDIYLVNLLLQLNADPNALNIQNESPLFLSAEFLRFDIFNILIENGADPTIKNEYGTTIGGQVRYNIPVIMEAVSQNNYKAVKILLEHGADANATMEDETTPLMIAALNKKDSYEIVSLLIEKGANVNACNKTGSTALFYSAYKGKTEVVKLLLKKGANPNHLDTITTPLMIAAAQNEYEICKILIENGADKYAVDEKGFSVMDYAKMSKNIRIVELMK